MPYTGDVIPTGVAPLLISTDTPNFLTVGTDGLLVARGPFTLHSTGIAVGNVGGGIDTLASVNVPANTLDSLGDRLRWRAVLALNTNLFDFCGFTFSYGGVTILTKPTTSGIDAGVVCEGEIIRTAAANQRSTASGIITDNVGFGTYAGQDDVAVTGLLLGLNNAAAHLFEVIGESSGAVQQVVLESLTIDVFPL